MTRLAAREDSDLPDPPLRARMFTESIAQLDQSNAPREPSSSRTRRWSLAHALAFVHSAKRR